MGHTQAIHDMNNTASLLSPNLPRTLLHASPATPSTGIGRSCDLGMSKMTAASGGGGRIALRKSTLFLDRVLTVKCGRHRGNTHQSVGCRGSAGSDSRPHNEPQCRNQVAALAFVPALLFDKRRGAARRWLPLPMARTGGQARLAVLGLARLLASCRTARHR